MPDIFPAEGDHYAIFQLKSGSETRGYRYVSLDELYESGLPFKRENYELVYTAPLTLGGGASEVLEALFEKFNRDHPADYRGRSMSVSDVVALRQGGTVTYHYCDPCGFKELFEFDPELYFRQKRSQQGKAKTPQKNKRER